MSEITRSLLISLIGMGLVFAGILVLWGMMALLVRFLKDKEEVDSESTPAAPGGAKIKVAAAAVVVAKARWMSQQAAAAAVSTALAADQSAAYPIEIPTAALSSWQVAHRLEQINLRNQSFNRKSRGE